MDAGAGGAGGVRGGVGARNSGMAGVGVRAAVAPTWRDGVAVWNPTVGAGLLARSGRDAPAVGEVVAGGWNRSAGGTVAGRIGRCRGVRSAALGAWNGGVRRGARARWRGVPGVGAALNSGMSGASVAGPMG